jgi:membrane protease YdiL (CAAX protease family)
VAIALIIAISLLAALAIIYWLVRRGTSFAAFGFSLSSVRWLVFAVGLGLPLGLGAAWLAAAFPSAAPIEVTALLPWQQVLFFVIAAPLQEEVIFRGLVQSVLQARWPGAIAVVCTAVLFAIVHIGSGLATVAGALVLSALAGELRRRSGSLLPAIAVHSLFNIAAMLVPA